MLDENEETIEYIYASWGKGHNKHTNSYIKTHVENNLLTIHIKKPRIEVFFMGVYAL